MLNMEAVGLSQEGSAENSLILMFHLIEEGDWIVAREDSDDLWAEMEVTFKLLEGQDQCEGFFFQWWSS